ncbi:MAG: hypothetical protein IJI66_15150 [Erysipelotrichaceae bacterium]|nr:hypothetical protein [Erysipelotrichaceae bacterium]
MQKNNMIDEKELEKVVGGTFAQLKEIREFIKANDPDYADTPVDEIIVMDWLNRNLGIKKIGIRPHGTNDYELNENLTLNHEQLMELLRSKY